MIKVSRTIRMDQEISKKLDSICVRHGDVTWHVEQALDEYLKKLANESRRVNGE